MAIQAEIQSLSPSALMEMFVLDTTNFAGGGLSYFHAGTNKLQQPLVWQGKSYTALPIEAEGFDLSAKGQLPKPRIRIANINGLFSAQVSQNDDLIGCKITRKRTFARYLDQENFPGWIGKGLYQNGTARYVSVPNNAKLQITGDLTICMTLRPDSLVRSNPIAKAYGGEFTVTQETSGSLNFFHGSAGADGTPYEAASSPALTVGKLNRVVLRRKAGSYIKWTVDKIDGAVKVPTITPVASTSPLTIGTGYAGNYNGLIADVRIYNKVLTDQDVLSYCNGGTTTSVGLVANWLLSGDTNDSSANALNGSAVGSLVYQSVVTTNPDADPNQYLADEVWFVDRKVSENKYLIEWELASAFDVQGVMLPFRQIIQNSCSWKYRSAECGYTGTSYFDRNDLATTQAKDVCAKRLSSCKARFGNNYLPFGGFPGANRLGE